MCPNKNEATCHCLDFNSKQAAKTEQIKKIKVFLLLVNIGPTQQTELDSFNWIKIKTTWFVSDQRVGSGTLISVSWIN